MSIQIDRIAGLLILMLLLMKCNGAVAQESNIPDEKNNPIAIYDANQKALLKENRVKTIYYLSCKKEQCDTFKIEHLSKKGIVRETEYDEFFSKKPVKRNGVLDRLKRNAAKSSKFENGEWVYRDDKGNVKSRLRNTYIPEDSIYIHESIDEATRSVNFRNVMTLDGNYRIKNMTVFDPNPLDRESLEKTKIYTAHFYYNAIGLLSKKVFRYHDKLKAKTHTYEYYDNGLLKERVIEKKQYLYVYEYWE